MREAENPSERHRFIYSRSVAEGDKVNFEVGIVRIDGCNTGDESITSHVHVETIK